MVIYDRGHNRNDDVLNVVAIVGLLIEEGQDGNKTAKS